jgi:hypothetical protein
MKENKKDEIAWTDALNIVLYKVYPNTLSVSELKNEVEEFWNINNKKIKIKFEKISNWALSERLSRNCHEINADDPRKENHLYSKEDYNWKLSTENYDKLNKIFK